MGEKVVLKDDPCGYWRPCCCAKALKEREDGIPPHCWTCGYSHDSHTAGEDGYGEFKGNQTECLT